MKAIQLARCAAILLVTTGCATNVQILPPVTNETTIEPGSGVVLLQVADTTPAGRIYPISQVTLAAKDVNVEEEKLPRIVAQEDYGNSTQLFIGILPANEYSLTSLRSFHQIGDAYFSRFYPADIELGTFNVEAGKVTDLGTIAVFIDRSGEDYSYVSTRVSENDRGRRYLEEKLPTLKSELTSLDDMLTWNQDGNSRGRDTTYRRAVNRQIVTAIPYVDKASGAVTFASNLGIIIHRDADQEWSLRAFGEDIEIRFITEVKDQTLIITEFNELYYRGGDNTDWQQGLGVPQNQKIVFAGDYRDGYYLVTESGRTVSVWTTEAFDSNWKLDNSLTPKLGFFSSLDHAFGLNTDISRAGYLAVDDRIYLAVGDSLYTYEFGSKSFTDLDTPRVLSLQERNGVLTMSSGSWATSNKVSFDRGETWSAYNGPMQQTFSDEEEARYERYPSQRPKAKRPRFIGHPIFLNDQVGIGIHQGKTGRDEQSPYLIRTDDSGKSWYAVEDAALPEGCTNLVLANESEALLRCFLSGEFYRSSNQGQTWTLEREVSET